MFAYVSNICLMERNYVTYRYFLITIINIPIQCKLHIAHKRIVEYELLHSMYIHNQIILISTNF